MIKFDNTEVFNFEGAIRGMRNPLNSWDKSDSGFCDADCYDCTISTYEEKCPRENYKLQNRPIVFCIGADDMALAKKLIRAGSDHRKFMRQILVSVDITAPLYWWKEFDTYKVATVSNSCSTMHKIHDKKFTREDFSIEHLQDFEIIDFIIDNLNSYRELYLEEKDKFYWWQMIQLLPTSYNQRRTITLNYETLYNIYGSRRNHKLDEWSIGFMDWIKSLPYANELIIDRS